MAEFISNSRILVTGGAGFIGSNLAEVLLSCGNEVVVLDNFTTGKMENLQPVAEHRNFRLIVGDIRNMEDCRKAVDGVDYVLHEAALGSVPRSVKDPMTSTAVNILGFVNMLYASCEAGVRRFVYAASSSVYGDCKVLPQVEDCISTPLSPYAITKYADELFAGNFHKLYGIDTIGLRYFNVFGRRQDPSGAYAAVIPRFAMSLLNHESPVINGDGSQSRDFTYIDNVIQANLRAIGTENPDAVNQVYNVACGKSTTLNDLFACLRDELAGFDPEIAGIRAIHGEKRAGDIPYSLACIEKAERLLGYHPEFSAVDGIKHAAKWYFENL